MALCYFRVEAEGVRGWAPLLWQPDSSCSQLLCQFITGLCSKAGVVWLLLPQDVSFLYVLLRCTNCCVSNVVIMCTLTNNSDITKLGKEKFPQKFNGCYGKALLKL